MKISVEIKEVNHNCLNSALADFSRVLNQHFSASPNKIMLQDAVDDSFDSHTGRQKHDWLIKVSLEWIKIKTP